jgi:16S rRNA (uracil1498-N3)-methyltransferase
MPASHHRFFEEKTAPAGSTLSLSAENARIARSVLRLSKGDRIVLLDGRGSLAQAELLEVGKARAIAAILEIKEVSQPWPLVTLLQGLPKGEKSSWIVQKCVEFGVGRVLFFESGRTIGKKGPGQADRWRRIAAEAMRQSGNPYLPFIGGPVGLSEALREAGNVKLGIFLDESEKNRRFRDLVEPETPASICVAVGPEGGWSDGDREELREAGFRSVGAGPFTLRTETAAIAALAAVRAWWP